MTIEIRTEQPGDEAAIREINDEAFGQPQESAIVDAARAAGRMSVSMVAVDDGAVIGHILFTPLGIESGDPGLRLLALGPMAVTPARQRQGIGSLLVRAGLDQCRRQGAHAVAVVGYPEFYPRFGFRPAGTYRLRCPFDVPGDAFMVVELAPGALAGAVGVVRFIPEFSGPE